MMIGEDEYHPWETLPAYAGSDLKAAGYRVTIVHADAKGKNNFPGIEAALRDADLLFVSVRRRTPVKEQLDAVRAYLASGKPLVGIRTASHAFALARNAKALTDPKLAIWQDFDPEVLGGRYTNHPKAGIICTATTATGAENLNPTYKGREWEIGSGLNVSISKTWYRTSERGHLHQNKRPWAVPDGRLLTE